MHLSNNNKQHARGRPNEWTDEELMKLALDTKYKHHGKKLTPSLLERETKVGRNTWSRRMKQFIDELNNPIVPNISADDENDAILPNIELIFKKYGNDKIALKNELFELEVLLYDFYKQIKEFKLKEEKYDNAIAKVDTLKNEVKKQEKRAKHYEELYNDIVVSSVYPHFQYAKESQINQIKNSSLDDLNVHFLKVNNDVEVKKSNKNK